MKRIIKLFIFLTCIIAVCNISIFANKTVQINLRVEGLTDTIMQGRVEAETFIRALQKLGNEKNVEVIIAPNSGSQELYSINGIKNNNYNKNDGWKGYIIRNQNFIEVDDMFNTPILANDELVVYYGSDDTKRVTDIKESFLDNKLTLQFISSTVTWEELNNEWAAKTTSQNLKDIEVNLMIGDKKVNTQKTDEEGKVSFDLKSPNLYTYSANGYRQGDVPLIIKVPASQKLLGLDSKKDLTRSEFVALIVNYYNLTMNEQNKVLFNDLENNQYKDQIYIATSRNIINGDGENNFSPERRITMQEIIIMLCNLNRDKPNINTISSIGDNNASEWAQPYIRVAIEKGIIENTDYDWLIPVKAEQIIPLLHALV